MGMSKPRTKTDAEVLAVITRLMVELGVSPTIREIQKALNVGSGRTVLRYLLSLEKQELIERWPGARGLRVKGWEFYHDHDAALIRRDGLMCEKHPGQEFEHDPDCGGPGQAWAIEGKENILAAIANAGV